MNTEPGNKLIADFMGKPTHIMPQLLKYHTSWDWLMPVVEKIFMQRLIVEDFVITPGKAYIIVKGAGKFNSPFNPCYTTIQEVWYVVVKFIEWYNKAEKVQGSDTTMLNQGTEAK